MNRILTVLPYCQKDDHSAEKLLNWIAELDSLSVDQSILLMADGALPRERAKSIQEIAKLAFGNVSTVIVRVEKNENWGSASKVMFEQAANHIEQNYKLPWLWLEPDCVPLTPTWLLKLELAYSNCPKKFMGHIVTADQLKTGSPHMAGPGVYPNNSYSLLKEYLKNNQFFDLACAPFILPRAMGTPLIQHFWGKPDLAPTFVQKRNMDDAENVLTPSFLGKDAVLFHRCKDGSLIDLLSQKVQKTVEPDMAVVVPADEE